MLVDVVDSLDPPALMLTWGDPWVTERTVAGGLGMYETQFVVLCFAARIEPGPGIEVLEGLIDYVLARFQADANTWPLVGSQAPRRFDINGIPTLGARLMFRVPVSVNGGN